MKIDERPHSRWICIHDAYEPIRHENRSVPAPTGLFLRPNGETFGVGDSENPEARDVPVGDDGGCDGIDETPRHPDVEAVTDPQIVRMRSVITLQLRQIETDPHLPYSLAHVVLFWRNLHHPPGCEHSPFNEIDPGRFDCGVLLAVLLQNQESNGQQPNAPLVRVLLEETV